MSAKLINQIGASGQCLEHVKLFLSKKRHINDNGSVGYLNLKSTYFSTKILRPKFREFCKFSIILSRLNNFPPGLIDPRYFIIIERLEDKNN